MIIKDEMARKDCSKQTSLYERVLYGGCRSSVSICDNRSSSPQGSEGLDKKWLHSVSFSPVVGLFRSPHAAHNIVRGFIG